MANKQINELNELITVVENDLFVVYNIDSTSSERSMKVTLANVRKSINDPLQISYDTTAGLQVNHLDYVTFDTSQPNPSWMQGRLFWDSDNYTLAIYNEISDVTLQVGQETYIRVRNETGDQIDNGEVCYITGSSQGLPTVTLSLADSHDKVFNIGMATHNILNNSNGYITVRGMVRGLNTSAFDEGDRLFVSHTTPGALISSEPPAPYQVAYIGTVVTKDASEGSVLVYTGHHGGLGELSNLNVDDSDVDNSIIVWDFSTKIWSASHLISTDDTLSGDSDLNVPTEQAVKGYVDAQGWTYTSIVNTTSGTSVTLTTGIPSDALEIEVMLDGVSTTGSQDCPIIQLGDAGGIETSGYAGGVSTRGGSQSTTDGFYCFRPNDFAAGDEVCGVMNMARWDPSLHHWKGFGIFDDNGDGDVSYFSGKKTTSQALTTIRLTTSGGTATFDAGSARVRYR